MAHGTRARSAERAGVGAAADGQMFGWLADVLQRMHEAPGPAVGAGHGRDPFKAPQYDGQGDVEYFIQQFMEVADANAWTPVATRLHLQEALKEGARECGRAGTIPGILAAIRARHGLSAREARAQLASLK